MPRLRTRAAHRGARRWTLPKHYCTISALSVANHSSGGPSPSDPGQQHSPNTAPSLAKNTLYLTLGNAATIPIAVATNALLGRYLGAEAFGHFYLASTVCGAALLALEWGQQGAVPALVARNRARAATYLGTSLAWRCSIGVVMLLGIGLLCRLMGYSADVTWVLLLSFPVYVANSCAAGFKDTIRGFERTDIPALVHVGTQVLGILVLIPVLLLGGGVRTVLVAQIGVAVFSVLALRLAIGRIRVGRLHYERQALSELFGIGTSFAFFDLALVVPPYINATFMAEHCPPEVIGWYGVAHRLVGLLLFPASALNGAMYPTLARLHIEDQDEFARVAGEAVYGASLLALPAAVCCGMFPEVGVAVFGKANFAGATTVLQVMSAFVLLVYVSMPIGTTLMAGNKRRAWTLVQAGCIVVSLAGNPFVLPYFQRTTGNGAIGAGALLVLSELFVVVAGFALLPKGVANAGLVKSLGAAMLAGVAMCAAAWLLKPISMLLAVPASLATYVVVGYTIGAIRPSVVEKVQGFLRRKFGARR
jgi:O-antigen/teichoic acid export membrane protein